MSSQEYRYEVKSIDGFLAQVVRYVACGGHYFYIRVRVPDNHRSPGSNVVDQRATVFGHDMGAARGTKEQWFSAHARECADRRIDAAGDISLCFPEQAHAGFLCDSASMLPRPRGDA